MKKHSILHIVGGSKYGGGAVIIEKLASHAIDNGYEVSVLTTDPIFIEHLSDKGIGVVNLDCIWRSIRPARDLLGLIRLKKYLSASDYEIIHTHTSKAGFVGRLAARWAKSPIIIHTVHGFAFHEASSAFLLKFYSILETVAAKFCDVITTVSNYHCLWGKQLGIFDDSKCISIPNGIDPDRVRPLLVSNVVRAGLAIENSQIMCLTMGRLAKQKGLDTLLRAVSISRKIKEIKIVIAGEGPDRQELELLCKELNISDTVSFIGFRQDVGDLLHASDIVILPSRWEGLSISLLEAMAAGKPIITTDIGSNLEVSCGGNALRIFAVDKAEKLALAIDDLVTNQNERKRLGDAALDLFQNEYTEKAMINAYMKLYDRMICQNIMIK